MGMTCQGVESLLLYILVADAVSQLELGFLGHHLLDFGAPLFRPVVADDHRARAGVAGDALAYSRQATGQPISVNRVLTLTFP